MFFGFDENDSIDDIKHNLPILLENDIIDPNEIKYENEYLLHYACRNNWFHVIAFC